MRAFSRFPGPADATAVVSYGRQSLPYLVRQVSVRYTIAPLTGPVAPRLTIMDGSNQLRFGVELNLPTTAGVVPLDVLTCFLPNFIEVSPPALGITPQLLNVFIPQGLIVMPQDDLQLSLVGAVAPGSGATLFASWTIEADFIEEIEGGDFDDET